MEPYPHKKIEKQFQKKWEQEQIYRTEIVSKKKKYYILDMFPYPSGAGLHVGHPRGYISSDVVARLKRMQGYNVLHPMGYDAFGLPAEQYAITHKVHPEKAVANNIQTYEKQLSIIGLSYDWSRKFATTDPEYYQWTQWIFLKLYESWFNPKKGKAEPIALLEKQFKTRGYDGISSKEWTTFSKKQKHDVLMRYRLAYEGYSEVNWCAELGTVLANDEVVTEADGTLVSERGNYPVTKKQMRQWFLRITAYADRLLSGLEKLDWPAHIKEIQRNWIGKSEGSEIPFTLSTGNHVSVFTTRADTLFGVTYVVLAPEHPVLEQIKDVITNYDALSAYQKTVTRTTKEKTGIILEGITARHPLTGVSIPVAVSEYVLAEYGTGACMAVPAHDTRDAAFAATMNLPVLQVLQEGIGHTEDGILCNSSLYDGMTSAEARAVLTKKAGGRIVSRYRIRDAVFARQRYWGEPIPLIHQNDGTITPVSTLPLRLPKVTSYAPTGTGESPLAGIAAWKRAGYETNTMPGWAGSSWYFLRFMDPHNTKAFAGKKALAYWKDIDMYVGGAEHATGHLLYARFWHQFLYDCGLVPTKEPFKALRNQGLILSHDGRKMSKRWGNVINPDTIVEQYGADTLRVYELFMGPFDQSLPWSTESIIGARRFLDRVWRVVPHARDSSRALKTQLHKTIKKVTEDIESFSFNTAVSALMICLNTIEKEGISEDDFMIFIQLLAPFAPHLAEARWNKKESLHYATWPKAQKKYYTSETVSLGVQVNGKVRGVITIAPDASEVDAQEAGEQCVAQYLEGKTIKKVIYVPGRILNFVIA